ncbi:unnamed protein product, partial [Effrenium voratum]
NFLQLDLCRDGYLWSKDALAWELQKMLRTSDESADEDAEGKIAPHEAEQLRNALDSMDMRTEGAIELTELLDALKKSGVAASDAAVQTFFRKLDLNHDGKISFSEFQARLGPRNLVTSL